MARVRFLNRVTKCIRWCLDLSFELCLRVLEITRKCYRSVELFPLGMSPSWYLRSKLIFLLSPTFWLKYSFKSFTLQYTQDLFFEFVCDISLKINHSGLLSMVFLVMHFFRYYQGWFSSIFLLRIQQKRGGCQLNLLLCHYNYRSFIFWISSQRLNKLCYWVNGFLELEFPWFWRVPRRIHCLQWHRD